MIYLRTAATGLALGALAGTAAFAECGIESGSVSILANDFPALQAVAEGAQACASDTVTVETNLTTEHKDIQVAALTANPAEYTAAVVANSSIVPLLNGGLIRPLDDLIAEYAPDLPATNKIVIDGQTMAVAFMANAQHLYYRSDLLEQAGVEVPTTYEEVVAAAQAIKDQGILENPFAMNTMPGFNLGEEFINMYLGLGGSFFADGTAEPAINNETGVQALEMLKQLTELSNPDYLTFDSNATGALWESGELALATMWGSRGAGLLDGEGSTEEVTGSTVLAAAPTVGGGTTPASTLWWDGFTIAANASDEDAAATFQALMNGISPAVIEANQEDAVWLSAAYQPTPASAGVVATAQAGAQPYPMLPYMGLMHTALGDNLAEFLQGSESAEQALSDVEAAYTTAATEQGFLQ